ncbi:MAG: type transport system permease protein, partial [Micromonosporaceae bacterium]|nr:type transport system permease protein [Micromonosporaceae bacterium]
LMTTATTPGTRSSAPARAVDTDASVLRRGGDLLASEWIKLWSVPSTYLALLGAAVAAPFISLGVAQANVAYLQSGQPHGPDHIDAMATSFRGIALAQLILAILGALAVTIEYGSGLVRTTFAAVPQRGAVMAAKATVIGAVALVFGQFLAFGCFLATQAVLAPIHVGLPIATPGAVRAVSGAGLYLAVAAMLGLGIGAVVRHTAAAIGTIVAVLFLLPQIPSVLPAPWSTYLANAMPNTAAQQISTLTPHPDLLTVGQSYGQLVTYAIAVPLLGALIVRRRDA